MTNKERQASLMKNAKGIQPYCDRCYYAYGDVCAALGLMNRDQFMEECPCAKAFNRMARKRRVL